MNCPKVGIKIRKKKFFVETTIIIIVVFLLVLGMAVHRAEENPIYKPKYKQINLEYIFEKTDKTDKIRTFENEKADILKLSNEDYDTLYKQTGFGRSAVDYILKTDKNYKKRFKEQQKIFFNGYPCTCVKIGTLTYNERMRDENGEKVKGYKIVDLQSGDVLISFSTHTMGYRHGHCGIVVSKPKKGKEAKTVEAVYWGKPTEYQTTGKWRSCPTLLHLRISKEAAESKGYTQAEMGTLLAECAKNDGIAVRYGLFPSAFNIKCDGMRRTHCSHLIWYVFNQFGFNVDSDGGLVVTPRDIAASDLFEIIQIYGIDTEL